MQVFGWFLWSRCVVHVCMCVCVCALWHKGNASQQNIEISTDTTQIEKNNFDEGLQMISALESFLKKTTPAHLRLRELRRTQGR